MHLYSYQLRLVDGEDAGTIATNAVHRVGATVIAHANRRYGVTAVMPIERSDPSKAGGRGRDGSSTAHGPSQPASSSPHANPLAAATRPIA